MKSTKMSQKMSFKKHYKVKPLLYFKGGKVK